MKELIVTDKFNNKKLQSFLMYNFSSLSASLFYKTLRKKDIKINNIRVNENVILNTGDNVKVYISDDILFSNLDKSIDIIYEDENILLANKPVGIEIVSQKNNSQKILNNNDNNSNDNVSNCTNTEISLTTLLKKQLNLLYLEPCHRLDRNTTGLILFAKNAKALDVLLNKFKNHEIEKHYLATVYGIPNIKKQTLKAYLFKDNKKSLVYISDIPKKGYVPITTKYTVLNTNKDKNYSILDVELLTGKTHQIRAHLAYIGYPIIGDGKYGKNEINKEFGFKKQKLCSYKIKFKFLEDASILNYLNNKSFSLPYNTII